MEFKEALFVPVLLTVISLFVCLRMTHWFLIPRVTVPDLYTHYTLCVCACLPRT